MSLNVGGIYVACTDRDRVVEIIREYWLTRGAAPITRDPLDIGPLSLGTTGELGFIVSPPTRAAEGEDPGPEWIAIYDSERYRGNHALAKHLSEALGASAVIYGMHGHSDIADIQGFGVPIPDLPACSHGDDEDCSDGEACACGYGGDWGEIEGYVERNFPFPFLYYDQVKDEGGAEFLDGWAVFGFENISHAHGGPSDETIRDERDKREMEECVERGDLARIEELYAANPRIQYAILSRIADRNHDPFDPAVRGSFDPVSRRLLLAFAERILEQDNHYRFQPVAEAALLEDDIVLFNRACARLGGRVADLTNFAWALLQKKDFVRGHQAARAATSSPRASSASWNCLAYSLIPLVKQERPADLERLLEEAGRHASVEPSIWHNIACVWANAGEPGRAIEAVACARRDGYDKMDAIAADDDLVCLRGDPRFEKALKEDGERVALSSLVRTGVFGDAVLTVNRPVVHFSFSVPMEDGPAFGRGAAAVLRRYCAEAPDGALAIYRTKGSPWEPLSAEVVAGHVDALADIPTQGPVSVSVFYRGGGTSGTGEASPYAVDIEYVRFEEGRGWRTIELCFPCEEAACPDALMQRFLTYADLVPYETGRCGLAMLTAKSNALAEHWGAQLTKRFHGFQPAMGWLTLVGSGPLGRIGGVEALRLQAPNAQVTDAPRGGALLRAALYPPVGIVTRPDDIGAMPEIARALRKLGVMEENPRMLRGVVKSKAGEEAPGLDGLANGAWVNNPPEF